MDLLKALEDGPWPTFLRELKQKNNKKLQTGTTLPCYISCLGRDEKCAAYKHPGCKW